MANLKTSVTRKQSMPNFPKKEHVLPPDTHTSVCVSGGKNYSFFGKFAVLCFLVTPVLRFAFLLYYQPYFFFVFQKKNWLAKKPIFGCFCAWKWHVYYFLFHYSIFPDTFILMFNIVRQKVSKVIGTILVSWRIFYRN